MTSTCALPVLLFNLGGEMVYILQQRLTAQKIPEDRAKRVLNEVVSNMFSEQMLKEFFTPQPLYSNESTRAVFDRLAHSSIMRLNKTSMDKLYDLMTMGVKHQIETARTPEEAVVHVTLNHIDTMRDMVGHNNTAACSALDSALTRLNERFAALSVGAIANVRRDLLTFFKDRKVRVSVFLEDKIQRPDGYFVLKTGSGALPRHIEVPGLIRVFDGSGKQLNVQQFAYNVPEPAMQSTEGPLVRFDSIASRVCKLGLNLYSKQRANKSGSGASGGSGGLTARGGGAGGGAGDDDDDGRSGRPTEYVISPQRAQQANAGINLLASMIAPGRSSGSGGDALELDLFDDRDNDLAFSGSNPRESASAEIGAGMGGSTFQDSTIYLSNKNVPQTTEDLRKLISDFEKTSVKSSAAPKRRDGEEDLLSMLDD